MTEEHLASVQTLSIINKRNFILMEVPQRPTLTDPTTRLDLNLCVCAHVHVCILVRVNAVTPIEPFCPLVGAERHCSATANSLLAAVERKPTHIQIYYSYRKCTKIRFKH